MNTPIYDGLVIDLGNPVAIGREFLKALGGQPETGRRRAKHKKSVSIDDVT